MPRHPPALEAGKLGENSEMDNINIIDKARAMARLCLECIYCNTARQEQKGLAYECVKNFTEAMCPFRKIYQAELRALDASARACV